MSKKILIVDDEPEIVSLLENFFTIEGYEVDGTTSPREAVKRVQAESLWVVITDLTMPEMSGLDLMREIKKCDGMVQMIAITGYVTIDNVLTAFRLGVSNLFFKPFDSLDSLKAEVEQAFDKRKRINKVLNELRNLKSA